MPHGHVWKKTPWKPQCSKVPPPWHDPGDRMKKSHLICLYLSFVRTHIKFSINILEIDFVILIKWYLTFWPPGPQWVGPKSAVVRPIYVSNSHTKFGWISSNGLGGGQTEAITSPSPFFKKKRGDKKEITRSCQYCKIQYLLKDSSATRHIRTCILWPFSL